MSTAAMLSSKECAHKVFQESSQMRALMYSTEQNCLFADLECAV